MKTIRFALLLLLFAVLPVSAADLKPIVLDPSYEHDKWVTNPVDIKKEFRAYITGLDFLTALPDDLEERVKKVTATELWPQN